MYAANVGVTRAEPNWNRVMDATDIGAWSRRLPREGTEGELSQGRIMDPIDIGGTEGKLS